jgi:hypothetical protein
MSQWQQILRQRSTLLRELSRPIARIGAFGVLPAISLISTLVVLPTLSGRYGQAGWSSVLLGQSIGAAASVVCALGWPVEGANLASQATPPQRRGMYKASILQRTAAVGVATPLLIGVCLAAEPKMPLVCVLSAFAMTLNALSPAWYFVGVSRPSHSLVAEGGPRLVVNVGSIALVAFLPLWTYPTALIVGMMATLGIAAHFVGRDAGAESDPATDCSPAPRPSGGRIPLLAVLARGVDAGYQYLTGPLVALVAAPAYPVYAAVDRLSQSLVNVMATVTQGLMAWIGESGREVARRRLAGAVLLALAFAGLSVIVFALTTPLLLNYLFAGTVEASPLLAIVAGATISGVFLSKSLAVLLLVPQGLARAAYQLLVVGSCLGLPAVGLAAASGGSTGALIVSATGPWILVAGQLAVGLRHRHGPIDNSVGESPNQV